MSSPYALNSTGSSLRCAGKRPAGRSASMAQMRRHIVTPGQEENRGQGAMTISLEIDRCEATADNIRHYVYIFKSSGTNLRRDTDGVPELKGVFLNQKDFAPPHTHGSIVPLSPPAASP
jgi:hypothetical protein